MSMEQISWTQNGVTQVWKLLPGGTIGTLADCILEQEAKKDQAGIEKILAIRSGDVQKVRAIQRVEGVDITREPISQSLHDLHGIPVTVFHPEHPAENRPCVIFFHGGGWQYGGTRIIAPACRYLAEQADAVVVSPDYRLAPEHKWPAGPQDCWDTLLWVHDHAEELDIDPKRVFVCGDSAGGNLAALCSHRDRDEGTHRIAGQILYYGALAVGDPVGLPGYSFTLDDYIMADSAREQLIPRIQALYNASKRTHPSYLPEGVDSRNSAVSPLWDSRFDQLPPTLLITAQYDYLTQQSRAYAARLAKAGVPVTWMNYCGMTHAFVDRVGVFPQADDSLREAAAFIRRTHE